jgi:hypothetical protein
MSELTNIRDNYLDGAKELHDTSCEIMQLSSSKISKKVIRNYIDIIFNSYKTLLENDISFSNQLRIRNGYSNSHPDTSGEEFVMMNRSIFISNLEKLEKEIMNLENAKQFRFSINLALSALIISSVGILLSIIL